MPRNTTTYSTRGGFVHEQRVNPTREQKRRWMAAGKMIDELGLPLDPEVLRRLLLEQDAWVAAQQGHPVPGIFFPTQDETPETAWWKMHEGRVYQLVAGILANATDPVVSRNVVNAAIIIILDIEARKAHDGLLVTSAQPTKEGAQDAS